MEDGGLEILKLNKLSQVLNFEFKTLAIRRRGAVINLQNKRKLSVY